MDFSNKTSLFDLVSMIIPGYTLIFSLSKILPINGLDYSGATIIPILAASYIVGMIIHHLSKLIFDRIFRDDTELMGITREEVYGKQLKDKEIDKIKEDINHKFYEILSHRIKNNGNFQSMAKDQQIKELKRIRENVLGKINDKVWEEKWNNIEKKQSYFIEENPIKEELHLRAIKTAYYHSFYQSINRYKNSSIHILEAQFSFIRSMIFVLPFLLTYVISDLNKIDHNSIILEIGSLIITLIGVIAVIGAIKENKKNKNLVITTVITTIIITIIIITLIKIMVGIEAIKADIGCDSWLCITITSVVVNTTLASWILPTINKQIYKSVWEDELYTRDLDT